jgi:hypothetical protein
LKLKGQFVTRARVTKAYAFRMKFAFARWYIAAILGAAAAWAAINFPADERQKRPTAAATEVATVLKGRDLVGQLRRDPFPPQAGQLFAVYGLVPARPVLPSPALKLASPQFPFRFAGYLKQEDDAITLYLTRGTEILQVRAGDLVEGFRIETFNEDSIEGKFVATGEYFSLPFPAVAAATGSLDGNAARMVLSPVAAAPALGSGPVPVWPPPAGAQSGSP